MKTLLLLLLVLVGNSTYAQLQADFNIYHDGFDQGCCFFFEDASNPGTGTITTWIWDYGNGETGDLSLHLSCYDTVGAYTVCLTVVNAFGDSSHICKPNLIIVDSTGACHLNTSTGISNISKIFQTKIFPNPITDNLIITAKSNEAFMVIIQDLFGRTLLSNSFISSTTIDTRKLTNGLYLYQLQDKNGLVMNGKIIKN